MSKIDTSPTKQNLFCCFVQKACSKNLPWGRMEFKKGSPEIWSGGEWGLFPVVASLRMALVLPVIRKLSGKNFSIRAWNFSPMLSINWRRFYVSRETSANVYIGVFRILACILQVGAWYLAHVKNDIIFPSSTFIASTRHLLPEVYVCEMIEVLTFLPKSLDICFLCIFRANFLVNYFHPKTSIKSTGYNYFLFFRCLARQMH